MNFKLLENGIDSLKQAQFNIDENYLDYEFESFRLKDGLFNFVHGFEILAKYIISNENEVNIIKDNYKERYRIAKSRMNSNQKSVFDVDPGIQTITPKDALKIIKNDFSFCNQTLYVDAIDLIHKRNELMHYTIEMNELEKRIFVDKLRNCIDLQLNTLRIVYRILN